MNRLFQNIPEDWRLNKIGNYTTNVEYGLSKAMNTENLGVPILRMNNLDGEGFLDLSDLKYVDIIGDEIKKYKINKDDILFNRVNSVELVGKTSIVKENIDNLVFASYLIRVIVDIEQLLPDYLNYYLNSQLGTKEINRNLKRASSQANINAKELRSMKILVPPIKEQKKIISIFMNIDNIIKKTQKLIEILHILKKGLMRRFFTEGIGHSEFKETRLGIIPENWEIKTISEVVNEKDGLKRGPWGGSVKKAFFVSSGYKIYEQKCVIANDFSLGTYYIDEDKFQELIQFEIKSGDLLMTAAGTLGRLAFVPEKIEPGIYNQALIRIRIRNEIMNKIFFKYFLESDYLFKIIERFTFGSAIKNFASIKTLSSIPIPVPIIHEQEEIVKILKSLDKKIKNEKTYQDKLKELKKGLMQVLLTGKKRIPI